MDQKFRTTILITNPPVYNQYKYKELFQILPAENCPQPPALMNDYPCILEFKIDAPQETRKTFSGNDLPLWVIENEVAGQKTKEICLLLSTLTTGYFFQYSSKQSWFTSFGIKGNEKTLNNSEWGQEAYIYDDMELSTTDFSKSKYPEIEIIDTVQYFSRFGRTTDQFFDIPDILNDLLDVFFNLDDEAQKVFVSSCSLFHQGLKIWSEHPSLSFAAFVSSIETLVQYENRHIPIEKCKTCGQDRYRVTKKFIDFFTKYGVQSKEFKVFASRVYSYRSKILHTGELFIGEIEPMKFGSDDGLAEGDFRRSVIRSSRICIINWLGSKGKPDK